MKKSRSNSVDTDTNTAEEKGTKLVDQEYLSEALNRLRITSTPCVPTPEKFVLGTCFARWAVQARAVVSKHDPADYPAVILGLLSGEAADIVFQAGALDDTDLDSMFHNLRQLLDIRLHPVEYQSQFYKATQRRGESIRTYAFRLKQLTQKAFPGKSTAELEQRALERMVEGVHNPKIKRKLIKRCPEDIMTAVAMAVELELIERAVSNEDMDRNGGSNLPTQNGHSQPSGPEPDYRRGRWPQKPIGPWRREGFKPITENGRPLPQATRNNDVHVNNVANSRPGELVIPSICLSDLDAMLMLPVILSSRRMRGLVDTGAVKSLIDRTVLGTINGVQLKPYNGRLLSANGEAIGVAGRVFLTVDVDGMEINQEFIVAENLSVKLILGMDILRALNCTIDMAQGTVSTGVRVKTRDNIDSDESQSSDTIQAASVMRTERLLSLADTDATQEAREHIDELIHQYRSIMCWEGQPLGRTDVIQHRIDTGQSGPIRLNSRRIPGCYLKELEHMIKDMLRNNVIQPSKSPWAAPVVLVKKKNGSMRLCVDYRKLNEVTKKDRFPLPIMEDLFDALAGARIFSSLDLASGYWQVEVAEEDREKTAFVVPNGLYEFQTMPFGLSNAPATFQRLMSEVLKELIPHRCLVYMDDVIVHGRDEKEHLDNLRAVFACLADVGLKLQPAKCVFLAKKIRFLGHVICAEGISTDVEKTDKVANWPTPENEAELRSFLGLASYYRRFVAGFSAIAAPLTSLLCKNVPFEWSAKCTEAFVKLQEALCSAPLLRLPDLDADAGQFILDTDASENAIGPCYRRSTQTG